MDFSLFMYIEKLLEIMEHFRPIFFEFFCRFLSVHQGVPRRAHYPAYVITTTQPHFDNCLKRDRGNMQQFTINEIAQNNANSYLMELKLASHFHVDLRAIDVFFEKTTFRRFLRMSSEKSTIVVVIVVIHFSKRILVKRYYQNYRI